MSEFRGPFFRQSQTDSCSRIAEPPQKGFDEHNPPGSMFREPQTLHIYGTLRSPCVHSESVVTPLVEAEVHSPSPQIETPEGATNTGTYQAAEFLSVDLSHITNSRLCIMGAIKLIDRATELANTDGIDPRNLRDYSKKAGKSLARFDHTVKPRGPIGFLRKKLFDD